MDMYAQSCTSGCQLGLNVLLARKCHWHGVAFGLCTQPEGRWLRLNLWFSCDYSALHLVEVHIRPAWKPAEWTLASRQMSECNFYVHYLPRNFNVAFLLREGKGKSCSDYKCMSYSTSTITLNVIKILHCCLSITYWLQSFASTKMFRSLQFYFDFIFQNTWKVFVSSYCSIFPLISALTFTNRWKIAYYLHRRIQKTQKILIWLLIMMKLLCCPFWMTFLSLCFIF